MTREVANMQDRVSNQTASKRRIVAENRRYLYLRQMGICGWCGKPISDPYDGNAVHIDHVVPLEQGGFWNGGGPVRRSHYESRKQFRKHRDKLRLVHAGCNLERGNEERLSEVPF